MYCKCRHRFVNTICKSNVKREPIECNSDCWKVERDKKLALAFGNSNKKTLDDYENINYEYYPEDILEFAREYPKFT